MTDQEKMATKSTSTSMTTYPKCHHCGNDNAEYVCSGCKDISYCSRACQRKGWKDGGHSLICGRGDKKLKWKRRMHDAILDLFRKELDFLRNQLTNKEIRKFASMHDLRMPDGKIPKKRKDFQSIRHIGHYLHAGQIAICLAGVHACTLLDFSAVGFPEYASLYYDKVAKPWFQKHSDDLDEFFEVQIIRERVLVQSLCPCGGKICPTKEGEHLREVVKGGDCGALLFRNKEHELSGAVEDIFLHNTGNRIVSELIQCISFDSMYQNELKIIGISGGMAEVTYKLGHSSQSIFGQDATCCVTCFSFDKLFHCSDAKNIGQHFWKCRQAMEGFGFRLGISICDYDPESEDDDVSGSWPDKQLAEAWVEAAGGSVEECLDSINNADGGSIDYYHDMFGEGESASNRKQRMMSLLKGMVDDSAKE